MNDDWINVSVEMSGAVFEGVSEMASEYEISFDAAAELLLLECVGMGTAEF